MIWPVAVALTVSGSPIGLTAAAAALGAARFEVREAASRSLRSAGAAAVPALTAATGSPSPEVRKRAAAALAGIEADRLDTPTVVSLSATHLPADQVAAELARQTGYRVPFDGPAADRRPVTLALDRVPFWRAVDAICDAAGGSAGVGDDGTVRLTGADAGSPFVSYAGPFRLTAVGATSGRSVQLGGLPRGGPAAVTAEHLTVSFVLWAEPKAPVVGVGQPVVHGAADDGGRSLLPPAEARSSHYPPAAGHRSLAHGFSVGLVKPDRAAAAIRTLRGSVPVLVLAECRPDVTVTDPLAPGRAAAGRSGSVAVTGCSQGVNTLALDVTVSRTAPADGWQSAVAQRLELHDAAGRPWLLDEVLAQTSTPTVVTLSLQYRPAGAGRPTRLTLVEWRTAEREVGFEFRDLPLP